MAQAAAHPIPKHRRIRPKPKLERPMSTREFRQKAEALVEQMIDLLDKHDGDETPEDTGDLEPSLGAPSLPHGTDCEADPGEQDTELGWTGDLNQERAQRNLSGTQWAANLESEHDGREPSLGSVATDVSETQEHWTQGSRNDAEAGYVTVEETL